MGRESLTPGRKNARLLFNFADWTATPSLISRCKNSSDNARTSACHTLQPSPADAKAPPSRHGRYHSQPHCRGGRSVTDPQRQLSTPSETSEFYTSSAVAKATHLFTVKDVPLPHSQAVRESIDNGVCPHVRRVPSYGIVGACSAIALLLLLVVLAPGTEDREEQGCDRTIA